MKVSAVSDSDNVRHFTGTMESYEKEQLKRRLFRPLQNIRMDMGHRCNSDQHLPMLNASQTL